MDKATEKVGMLIMQIVRFVKILSPVVQQFSNFFNWLFQCIKILMSESVDQLPTYNSELVVMFLKFLYDQDPVRLLLYQSVIDHYVQVDRTTSNRAEELVKLGDFADTECLNRTLAKEFYDMESNDMESSFKEAFNMPYTTISKEIICQQLLPMFSFPSSPSIPNIVPASISFYWDAALDGSISEPSRENVADYIAFQIPEWSSSGVSSCLCIVRGIIDKMINIRHGYHTLEAILLSVSEDFSCVDLSLYKERQVAMLLNERATSDSNGSALLMILQAADLPFASISKSNGENIWKLDQLQASVLPLQMETAKVRSIPYSVVPPLAVSSSRGVGCIFTARKRGVSVHSRGRNIRHELKYSV